MVPAGPLLRLASLGFGMAGCPGIYPLGLTPYPRSAEGALNPASPAEYVGAVATDLH